MTQGRGGTGLWVPIILIALGGLFLAHDAGLVPAYAAREGWPLILGTLGAALLARRQALRQASCRALRRQPRP
ncbi:LiaI-LiaF-like domain-containing protein [Cupriavidus sp. 30B13]|uniref:hypothetical protein n=1 Tax=Cupriavidus sp. 30B13 TaxID=3384241 RepID=UPI003B9148ED